MPRILLQMPDRAPEPETLVEFDVVPVVGDEMVLRFGGGKRRWYKVAETFHYIRGDGESVGYCVRLEWSDQPPGRWSSPDDYPPDDGPPDDGLTDPVPSNGVKAGAL